MLNKKYTYNMTN